MTHLTLTQKQQEAIEFADSSEENEITFQCATGFGKTYVMVRLLQDESRSIVVFPTLVLLDDFRTKYMGFLEEKDNVITVCTYAKDMKTVNGDVSWVTTDKKVIHETLKDEDEILVLTTYNSLPYVLQHLEEPVDGIHFDEAHHRSGPTIVETMEKHSHKAGRIYNYSATPSDECGGDYFEYNFAEAIQDGAIRDFTVHFIIGDKRQVDEMPELISQMASTTNNKKGMVFTSLSLSEKEGKHNVKRLEKDWNKVCKKLGVWIKGITCNEKLTERQSIIEDFASQENLSLLISCRTLGEGTDIKGTNCGIFMDTLQSKVQIMQCIGRLLRLYRDSEGSPLPDQPPSVVILPIFVDGDAYEKCVTEEEKDLFLRNLCETDNGSFSSILNVVSALREYDPEMSAFCLHYPSGLLVKKLPEVSDTLKKQGWRIEDVPRDGNCFFHNASAITGESAQIVRKKVVDYLRNNAEMKREYGLLEDEIDELAEEGTWNNNAGDIVPKAFSELYKVPISVHLGDGMVHTFGDTSKEEDVEHLLLVDDHYMRLVSSTPSRKINEPMATGRENTKKVYRRKFRGHVSGAVKVLWSGAPQNDFMMKLEHRVEMDGKTLEDLWDEKLEKVKDFLKENDRLPSQKASDPQEKFWGSWVSVQKKNYKNRAQGMQDIIRCTKWEALVQEYAVLFQTKDDVWDEMLKQTKTFIEKYDKLPSRTSMSQNGTSLGGWVHQQVTSYNTNRHKMKDLSRRQQWKEFVQEYSHLFKDLDEVWDEMLYKLKIFIERVGKLPSEESRNRCEKVLGRWTCRQKQCYKLKKERMQENSERRHKWKTFVEDYSNIFRSKDEVWDDMLEKVRTFIKENNKLPSQTKHSKGENRLSSWLNQQKVKHKARVGGMQDESRYNEFEAFMEEYHEYFKDGDQVWDEMLTKLRIFVKEKAKLPSTTSTSKTEQVLGQWASRQKSNYRDHKDGMKNKARRARWETFIREYKELLKESDQIWDEMLTAVNTFIEKNGKLPSSGSHDKHEKSLGYWVNNQKTNHKTGKLNDYDKDQNWETFVEKHAGLFKTHIKRWDDMMEQLLKFIEHHGKLPLTQSNHEDEKVLGQWTFRQKTHYRDETEIMKEDHCRTEWEKLTTKYPELFKNKSEVWDDMMTKVKTFVTEKGRLPSSQSKLKDEKVMGKWVDHQKQNYKIKKHGMEDECRCKKWENFMQDNPCLFRSPDQMWYDVKENLARFIEHNLKLPSQHSKNKDETFLGQWINRQKMNHQAKKGGMRDPARRRAWEDFMGQHPTLFKSSTPAPPKTPSRPPQQLKETAEDKLAEMTQEKKDAMLLKYMKSSENSPRKYGAPNTDMKDEINSLLSKHKPSKGNFIVLDHTDFRTTTALFPDNPQNLTIPQRDLSHYQEMSQHPSYGASVKYIDIIQYLSANKSEKYSLVYADLMGSIKEAKPILQVLKNRITKNGVVAVTISCRDGEESEFTNSFATKLVQEMNASFPRHEVLTPSGLPLVYGEHVRMATHAVRLT